MATMTKEQLVALAQIDTPTICNAIEEFGVRNVVEGFMGAGIRCFFPDFGPMVGYAVTAKIDTSTPNATYDIKSWIRHWEMLRDAPKPGVLVIQDVGPRPAYAALFGEGMATISQRLGMVGMVTNGAVRDVAQVKALGFHYFAPGASPSHGNFRSIEFGTPVVIDGVEIRNGDLIHADWNGVTTIPDNIALDRLIAASQKTLEREAEIFAILRAPDFTIDKYVKWLGW